MTRLLLDEMISPYIVRPLWDSGIDTVPARDRDLLSSSDNKVWMYAQREARTIVTGNIAHFERIARKYREHFGVIAMPPGGTREDQLRRIMTAVEWAAVNTGDNGLKNLFAYVDENGAIHAALVAAANDNADQLEKAIEAVKPVIVH